MYAKIVYIAKYKTIYKNWTSFNIKYGRDIIKKRIWRKNTEIFVNFFTYLDNDQSYEHFLYKTNYKSYKNLQKWAYKLFLSLPTNFYKMVAKPHEVGDRKHGFKLSMSFLAIEKQSVPFKWIPFSKSKYPVLSYITMQKKKNYMKLCVSKSRENSIKRKCCHAVHPLCLHIFYKNHQYNENIVFWKRMFCLCIYIVYINKY